MTPNPVMTDPILDEIHQTRERIAKQFDGDTGAILEDARQRQAASGRAIWQRRDSSGEAVGSTPEAKSKTPN